VTYSTGEIEVGEDGVQGTDGLRAGIGLILGGAGAWSVSKMIGSLRKRSLRRRVQKRKADSG